MVRILCWMLLSAAIVLTATGHPVGWLLIAIAIIGLVYWRRSSSLQSVIVALIGLVIAVTGADHQPLGWIGAAIVVVGGIGAFAKLPTQPRAAQAWPLYRHTPGPDQ